MLAMKLRIDRTPTEIEIIRSSNTSLDTSYLINAHILSMVKKSDVIVTIFNAVLNMGYAAQKTEVKVSPNMAVNIMKSSISSNSKRHLLAYIAAYRKPTPIKMNREKYRPNIRFIGDVSFIFYSIKPNEITCDWYIQLSNRVQETGVDNLHIINVKQLFDVTVFPPSTRIICMLLDYSYVIPKNATSVTGTLRSPRSAREVASHQIDRTS